MRTNERITGFTNVGGHLVYDMSTDKLTTLMASSIRITWEDGNARVYLVQIVYFSYDLLFARPTKEVDSVINYCKAHDLQIIVGADANLGGCGWAQEGKGLSTYIKVAVGRPRIANHNLANCRQKTKELFNEVRITEEYNQYLLSNIKSKVLGMGYP